MPAAFQSAREERYARETARAPADGLHRLRAVAQDAVYPNHTVRIIVSSGPGGNPDVLARMLADRMGKDFGVAFVVENVTGAGGALSAITAAKALADGYTLFSGDSVITCAIRLSCKNCICRSKIDGA
jgi:tripartite-type tricarboxylate transporter receptor subunit TctC